MYQFLILYDKRGYTAGSLLSNSKKKIDLKILKKSLCEYDATVETKCIHDISFPSKYNNWYVIYPSSEDAGLFYKEYIEDILLRLSLDGAILLPKFELFRAHHNKVFMELYRTRLSKEYNTIKSTHFYGIDDLKNKIKNEKFPVIVKTSAGAGSSGVSKVDNFNDAVKRVKKMGRISYYNYYYSHKRQWIHFWGRLLMNIRKIYYMDPPKKQEKMIYQTFIPNLDCDYKVLVFGHKYYLLNRKVRQNDFRASGSGYLEFPNKLTEKEKKILSYAKDAYKQLDTPLLSIDIAYDGNICHMIEFQCLNFGPYTLQFSPCYYVFEEDWKRIEKKSVLEKEMANSYVTYIQRNKE